MKDADVSAETSLSYQVPLLTVLRQWGRIGVTGFGGPPAHIALLRTLVVDQRGWLSAREFEDAISACNLLPGPASTQLAIFCALRVRGRLGALVGGLAFVVPAVVCVLLLSWLFFGSAPPLWVAGAGAGAGAAVAAVAAYAAWSLLKPSFARAATVGRSRQYRWGVYAGLGVAGAIVLGPYLVLLLLGCGAAELTIHGWSSRAAGGRLSSHGWPVLLMFGLVSVGSVGGIGALVWEAFKVGALSYGGGFVIIPLMQHDAVSTYHWMSSSQFLDAVALGQITPGPVVSTVAAVGYAAHGLLGGVVAAGVAFSPSFAGVMILGPRFEALRASPRAQAFLDGAGPAAVGAILGSAVPLSEALKQGWQFAVLAAALGALFALRRSVVETLLGAGIVGVVLALAGVAV